MTRTTPSSGIHTWKWWIAVWTNTSSNLDSLIVIEYVTIIFFYWSLPPFICHPFYSIYSCFLSLYDWTTLECLDFCTRPIRPIPIANWMHLGNSTLFCKVHSFICSQVLAYNKDMPWASFYFSCSWLCFQAKGDRFERLRFHFLMYS